MAQQQLRKLVITCLNMSIDSPGKQKTSFSNQMKNQARSLRKHQRAKETSKQAFPFDVGAKI